LPVNPDHLSSVEFYFIGQATLKSFLPYEPVEFRRSSQQHLTS
jgi:hypothetical protein